MKVYSPYGGKIDNSDGLAIEQGGGPDPVDTFGPGDTLPNYTLKPPSGLTIMGSSISVESRTLLSDLLQPNMGVCHWAACTEVE